MDNSSQSRQNFSLTWLDRSQTWLDQIEPLVSASWNWLVSHHQLLTLAKRAERQAGLSVLWFSVLGPNKTAVAFGARLPADRVALVSTTVDAKLGLGHDFSAFLRSKMKISSVMGAHSDLTRLGFTTTEIIERQHAWGKRLASVATPTIPRRDSFATALSSRRAGETDRALLARWAKLFAIETDPGATSIASTELEVAEWMKRGRLLLFETSTPSARPIAMAALSGDYTDRKFGRSCRLSLLFVDPIYRGRGYGRLAVEAIEHEARLENASGLVLYSDSQNERIKRFYSDLGFALSDDWLEVDTGFNVNTTG